MYTFIEIGIVPIGGAHIKPAKPLPENLQAFLDGAKDGAIYFSLGSNLKSSLLPKHRIREFLSECFSSQFLLFDIFLPGKIDLKLFFFRYIQDTQTTRIVEIRR